jgi:hypothetical protein
VTSARRLAEETARQAEFYLACAGVQERLADAKRQYAANPNPETAAKRRAAMQALRDFREYFRALSSIAVINRDLPGLADDDPLRPKVEAELEHLCGLAGVQPADVPAAPVAKSGSALARPSTIQGRSAVNRRAR